MKKKPSIVWLIFATVWMFIGYVAGLTQAYLYYEKIQCENLGLQEGITTEWTGWKCEFQSDPLDFFDPGEAIYDV